MIGLNGGRLWAWTHKNQELRIDQSEEKRTTRVASCCSATSEFTRRNSEEARNIVYFVYIYIYEQKINSYAVPLSQTRVFECMCVLADSLCRLNTIHPWPLSSRSYSFGCTPDMGHMAGTSFGAVQTSCGSLSHRRTLVSVRMTSKSVIGCLQSWRKYCESNWTEVLSTHLDSRNKIYSFLNHQSSD